MNEFEEKITDEKPEINDDVPVSEVGEDKEDKSEAKSAYGTVYIPGADGKTYTCHPYSAEVAHDSPLNSKNYSSDDSTSKAKKRGSAGKTIGIIAVALIIALLISSASAFAAAYITRSYYESDNSGFDAENPTSGNLSPEKDHVYIDKSNPDILTHVATPGELMTMEQAIDAVKDSVVEITTERVQSGFGGFSQYVVSGAGSGVIISTGGYIITNNHVIEGASNIIVRLTDGSEYTAKLIATDSKTDVAVISITPAEGVELTAAVIGTSDSLSLGQTVIAIGNPLGKLGGTVTDGIISSLAREIAMDGSGTMTLLQTNAAVSPGNSGGGLFDLYGRLIGVVNAKSTGDGVEGISFAIPIDTAWDVAQQLIEKGYVSGRPALGVTIQQVQYGVSIFGEYYYQLVVVDAGSNTELKVNDIILSVDEIEVGSLAEISDIISSHKIGDKITIMVRREKRLIDVEVTLIEYFPETENSQASQN